MIMDVFITLAAVALADPVAAQERAKPNPAQIECRTEVQTGTRIGRKKICTTKKIWDQIREEHLESTAHRKVDAEKSKPFRIYGSVFFRGVREKARRQRWPQVHPFRSDA